MINEQLRAEFWKLPIESLSEKEREFLCDRCGRCCLEKLVDEDTGEIAWTRIICRHYELKTGFCGCYPERSVRVPECIDVRKLTVEDKHWMPATCAYRRRFEGQPLPARHPLIMGSSRDISKAGIAVKGKVLSEDFVHLEGYHEQIIRWVDV
ncbi:MAG: hypothetical protein CMD92_07465 [Gammaproteobacteria bacterium]|nr:hypothetical protein [Gammaproteobacteria bacterium]HBW83730.1 hypothetical protein [Gammaproteobacteria bacterium]|tara:strand:- start:588 stop:1043 length:456 start_codon:yes stop_codon:yes gene_type:complete